MNVVGMAAGAVLLITGSAFAGESWRLPEVGETWAAVSYLVVVGSGIVFVLYLFVLNRWSASRTSYQFVLIPFATIALSAWLDDEPIGGGFVLGGLLILSGVYFGAIRQTADSSIEVGVQR